MLNEQSKHAAYIVKHALDHEVRAFEPSTGGRGRRVETIITSPATAWSFSVLHTRLLRRRG